MQAPPHYSLEVTCSNLEEWCDTAQLNEERRQLGSEVFLQGIWSSHSDSKNENNSNITIYDAICKRNILEKNKNIQTIMIMTSIFNSY